MSAHSQGIRGNKDVFTKDVLHMQLITPAKT